MIYLLGGAPRVGKSIIGRQLAETIGFEYVSTDDIDSKAQAAVSAEECAVRFPGPNFDGDPKKNTHSPEDRTRLQMITNESLRPIIDTIIRDAIHRNHNLVIEGAHLLPEHTQSLTNEFGSSGVRSLFLGWIDINAIANGIYQDTGDRNWLKLGDATVTLQVAKFVAVYSARIREEAEKYGCIYQERTNNFETDTQQVLQYFLS